MESIHEIRSNALFQSEDDEPLHVFDLPQIHTKPSASALLSALELLTLETPSWDTTPVSLSGTTTPHSGSNSNSSSFSLPTTLTQTSRRKVDPQGVPHYLTTIISSPLSWLPSDSDRDAIWTAASQALSSRSGRTGMGALSRRFRIPLLLGKDDDGDGEPGELDIAIHEPALTGDHLGLKTWASAYLLARGLAASLPLRDLVLPRHPLCPSPSPSPSPSSSLEDEQGGGQRFAVLELGAGTGLVGIAAAAVLGTGVVLTDLPAIEANLAQNVAANRALIERGGGAAVTAVLDWNEPDAADLPAERFRLVVAADCVYARSHPGLLAGAVGRWLERSGEAALLVESPMREGFGEEMEILREEIERLGLEIKGEGREYGVDDWGDPNGDELKEVECWWAVWGWGKEFLGAESENLKT